jgi:crotonobetainyl-CoA:carnitine CoA-transferase CaiB-like acyl-CoA transferase
MTNVPHEPKEMPMPLEGIRIVEYATFHAAPGASAILADLGAEVIKIEAAAGDPMRTWSELAGISFCLPDGEGLLYQFSNRNKKSICLDIEKGEGRRVFNRLIEETDVFVTNLRKSTKAALGLDYGALSRINPRIIHANISGFGPEGPASDYGAFDPMGQARSGMMFITGDGAPKLLHLAVLDQAVSICASQAVLTALFHRERRSVGQEVHVSLYGTALWLQYANLIMAGCISAEPISGDRLRFSPLRNFFCCKDGEWIIGTHHPEERYWPALLEATGQESLMKDPRFAEIEDRAKNREALVAHFDRVFAARPRGEWLEVLRDRGLMFGPVQRISDVFRDPQALKNGYVVDFDFPPLGEVKIPGYPVHFGASRAGTRTAAPALGAHTTEILEQAGYRDEEILELRHKEVIR